MSLKNIFNKALFYSTMNATKTGFLQDLLKIITKNNEINNESNEQG